MPIPKALARSEAQLAGPSFVTFEGQARAGAQVLRSPASGTPCVYWRLRVAQRLTDRSELVHEIASEESFVLLVPGADGSADEPESQPEARLRLEPAQANIEAVPVLHREGSPAAAAVARAFGLAGPLRVEEVVLRPGEALTAEGLLSDLDAAVGAGPFRGTSRGPELLEATVTAASKSLAPALLPWALGTAAALMSGLGLATYAAWRAQILHLPMAVTARVPRSFFRAPEPHAMLRAPELPRPRLP